MQSGPVELCFPLCKLMHVSINHKVCLKALYKRQAYKVATSQFASEHKGHIVTQRKKKYKKQKKYCKRVDFIFILH